MAPHTDVRDEPGARLKLRMAEAGNLGDWKTIGGKVSEMRVNFGPGYRLYFTRRGNVLML